ncbi:hypothetical protein [Streptomyces camelliae]|uniref:Integral membrane protein n=1 Tax=Streptomyces camelliae TaxID=3004093 RepID=A0ABY7P860_9ACTN|nr:hypothetical protein [Streptomyces sp. HUAS 2-6]WBO65021.1 hypothetical protein O1G22_20380 [Streptomyces sp. HUAS 2-6]
MGGESGGLKLVWVAVVLLGAAVVAGVVACVFWVAQSGRSTGDRVTRALAAGGTAFLGVATLGLAIGGFLHG